ncbi:Hsp20/alpha crystallin family protein [Isoptericola sp. JC619]|uniref:Hsp20/alpha crystallin family protein n=2 Tax=Promicromonosporaceae TaxID=85017 RepID=A0A849K213_9MICO|nr:Hsp20/alpha crystallin family protein [Isoptericola sediminis]
MTRDLGALWPARWDWPFGEGTSPRDTSPVSGFPLRVEEFREDGDLVVRAEIPGIDPDEDVEVTVDNGVLRISAHREERTRQEGDEFRSEFRYGSFERRIRLPQGADVADVAATYRDGVLEVRLPLPAERPETRSVPVQRT